jgi:hypothetical protein
MFPCARSGDPFQKEKKHRRGKGDQAIQPQFICKPNGLWKKKPTSPDPLNKVKTMRNLFCTSLEQRRQAETPEDTCMTLHVAGVGLATQTIEKPKHRGFLSWQNLYTNYFLRTICG